MNIAARSPGQTFHNMWDVPRNWEHHSVREIQELVHELQHYQIELELQNKELLKTLSQVEERHTTYLNLFDCAPVGYCVLDKNGFIQRANATAAEQFHVTKGDLFKRWFYDYVTEEDQDQFLSHLQHIFQEASPQTCPIRLVARDGTCFPAMLESKPVQDASRTISQCYTAILDMSDQLMPPGHSRKVYELQETQGTHDTAVKSHAVIVQPKTETAPAELTEEREVLLKEIHHRVKNNLQLMYSLLNLQTGTLQDDAVIQALQGCKNRINAMAIIHETFCESLDLTRVDLERYTQKLGHSLLEIYGDAIHTVKLDIDMREITVNLDMAILCGLILNELLTNALQHAFPDQREGSVHVSLYSRGQRWFTLVVRDDGIGIPAQLDIQKGSSLGLKLVHLLTQQLSGTMTLEGDCGTTVIITFPKHKLSDFVSV